jgi:paraquat-inducible protein B
MKVIKALVHKQRFLVREFRAALSEDANQLTLRRLAPKSLSTFDGTWAIGVHGVGVRFANTKSKEVVDVHVGLFDADSAFDAWRLEEYAQSIHSELDNFEPILERLAANGVIRQHESLANHYELLEAKVGGEEGKGVKATTDPNSP